MDELAIDKISPGQANGGLVEKLSGNGWRLSLPTGEEGKYRLAQIDNYRQLCRQAFPFSCQFQMNLKARTSSNHLPGTWGFGFWNDPFGMGLGLQGSKFRLPALPNTAWFFHASEENHLSFRNHTPGNGMLTGVFSAPLIPSIFSLAVLPFAPLLYLPASARLLRRFASFFINEEFITLSLDWTMWHQFKIDGQGDKLIFSIDDEICLTCAYFPKGRFGFVGWLDNQFMALRPDGKFRYGTSAEDKDAWLEICDLMIEQG